MNGDLFNDIWLEWDSSGGMAGLLEDDDPDNYVRAVDGRILTLSDDEEAPRQLGFFRLLFVDVGAAHKNGVDIFEVFDSNGETCEAFEDLYDFDSQVIKEEVVDLLGDVTFSDDLLLIQRLGILPEYRGSRLGLLVLRRIIERFDSQVGLVALHPAPFKFTTIEEKEPEESLNERLDDEQGVAALRAYYRRLGFLDIPGKPLMVISPAIRLPSVADLLKK